MCARREGTFLKSAAYEAGSSLEFSSRQGGQLGSGLDSVNGEAALGERLRCNSCPGSDFDHQVTLHEIRFREEGGEQVRGIARAVAVVPFGLRCKPS